MVTGFGQFQTEWTVSFLHCGSGRFWKKKQRRRLRRRCRRSAWRSLRADFTFSPMNRKDSSGQSAVRHGSHIWPLSPDRLLTRRAVCVEFFFLARSPHGFVGLIFPLQCWRHQRHENPPPHLCPHPPTHTKPGRSRSELISGFDVRILTPCLDTMLPWNLV